MTDTSTSTSTTTSPKPRRKRTPSDRNQRIYRAYKLLGRSQAELAEDYRVSQVRISQIICDVERWIARRYPGYSGQPSIDDRQRLERQLDVDRQTMLFHWAVKGMEKGTITVKTTKETRNGDGSVTVVTTSREVPIWMQAQRLAQRASEQLARLSDKPPPPVPDLAIDEADRDSIVMQALCEMRLEAEEAGLVMRSHDPYHVVDAWKQALLGDPDGVLTDLRHLAGDALVQVVSFYGDLLPSRSRLPSGTSDWGDDFILPDDAAWESTPSPGPSRQEGPTGMDGPTGPAEKIGAQEDLLKAPAPSDKSAAKRAAKTTFKLPPPALRESTNPFIPFETNRPKPPPPRQSFYPPIVVEPFAVHRP